MKERFRISKEGFTLSELLIATVIIVVALTMLLYGFTASILLNEVNRNLSIVCTHAQFVLEEIKNQNSLANIHSNISTGTWNWASDTPFTSRSLQRLSNENITTCCCVSPCSSCSACGSSPADPLGVLVTINWSNRGRARSINLTSFFTEP